MQRMINFSSDESGAETIEYAVVAGLIAIIAGAAYTLGLGTAIQAVLNGLIP